MRRQEHEQDEYESCDQHGPPRQQFESWMSPDHECCSLVCPWTMEGGRVVALLAFLAEAPRVYVITGMTGAANHRGFDDVLRPDVAIGATDLCVGA